MLRVTEAVMIFLLLALVWIAIGGKSALVPPPVVVTLPPVHVPAQEVTIPVPPRPVPLPVRKPYHPHPHPVWHCIYPPQASWQNCEVKKKVLPVEMHRKAGSAGHPAPEAPRVHPVP